MVGGLTIWLAVAARVAGAETTLPTKDVVAQFGEAVAQHRVGIARKTKPVDARPAKPGEIVVTVIKGEGVETRSRRRGGWREFRPRGTDMRYFIVTGADGAFSFTAPWGEAMVARPGDAVVQTPGDEKDTYRVAADSFACTYEIAHHP